MTSSLRRGWPALAILVWCAFVVTAYYISHKPANPQQIAALMNLGLTILGWVGTLALAHGLGRRLASSIGQLPLGQSFAMQVGLGLGVISLATLGLGAVGGLWRPLPWIAIIGAAPFTIRGLWLDVRQLIRVPIEGRSSRLLATFVALTMAMALVPALAPPTAWDSLVYHLTGPKLYIAAGRLVHDVDIPHLGFPQAAEMLFTWGMLLTGPELAQLFHATFAMLTLLLLGSVTEDFAPGKGWLAAALLAAVPSAMIIAGWAYVEWMAMFGGLASLTLLAYAAQSRRTGPSAENGDQGDQPQRSDTDASRGVVSTSGLVIGGFFAALAMSTKYTAIGMVAGLVLFAAWRLRPLRRVFIFVAGTAVFTFPYLLKNWFLTGNPFYPFFLPGVFWDTLRQTFYSRPGTGLDAIKLLLAPWDATIWGIEGGFAVGHPSYAATLGPLMLALIPLILLSPRGSLRSRPWFAALLLAAAAMYLSWLLELASSHLLLQSRLLFPALPMFVGLAVIGFDSLGRIEWTGFSIRIVVAGLIALVLGLTLVSTALGFIADNPLAVITGAETQARYYETRLGMYAWAMDGVNLLPDGSRVVFLWEPRSFACSAHVICEPDDITDRWWHMRRLGMSAADVAAQWRSEGVTHVLYYAYGAQIILDAGVDPYEDDDWSELKKLIDMELVEVERWGDAYVLYRLR